MKDFIHRFPNLTAFIGGTSVVVMIVVLTEAALWQVSGHYDDRGISRTYAKGYKYRDSTGSTRPLGKGSYRSTLFWEDRQRLIYDVTYTVDEHSRRVTPFMDSPESEEFAMFFGGSFTYGEGVEDNQTLPYHTVGFVKKYRPYNYGFHGHGPAEMLAKLESRTLPQEVPEQQGILVYTFIGAHIQRTIGSMSRVATWGTNKPYYYLTIGGELKREGSFVTGRWFLTAMYHFLHKSRILRLIDVDFPLWISPKHIKLVVRIIKESKSLFLDQFPNSKFYVLIWPGSTTHGEQLKQLLTENAIVYFDYPGLLNASDPKKYTLAPPVEWHPTSLAYQTVARKLTDDLRLRKEEKKGP